MLINKFLKKFLQDNITIVVVLISGLLLFFHHINQPGFFMDGLIYAAISKNMALDNQFLTPHISDTYFSLFTDHIPFMLILQALFFKVFGIGFWQGRVFINLFTLGLFLVVLFQARKAGRISQMVFAAFLFFLTLPLLKHGRHPNFDIPLALTVFLSVQFYIKAFEEDRFFHWLLCGLFFGLSMLLKGPMAIFVPMTIFIHLIYTKNLKRLLGLKPWLGLLFGFLIFGLWPLALYLTGHFEIFSNWFKFTIIDTIFGSRGEVRNNYFVYIGHLLTFTPLHILFFAWALYRLKGKYSNLVIVNSILFFVVLAITSYMKFKLSHYIMCLYPALILVASFSIPVEKLEKMRPYFVVFMLVGSLVNFFLPQNPKKNRDYEIFEIQRIAKENNLIVKKYYDLEDAYPYWSMASLIPFTEGLNVHRSLDVDHRQSIVITKRKFEDLRCHEIYYLENYRARAYYCP